MFCMSGCFFVFVHNLVYVCGFFGFQERRGVSGRAICICAKPAEGSLLFVSTTGLRLLSFSINHVFASLMQIIDVITKLDRGIRLVSECGT